VIGARGLKYERLDQLTIDLLLGMRQTPIIDLRLLLNPVWDFHQNMEIPGLDIHRATPFYCYRYPPPPRLEQSR
jgi:hypothetical protein